MTKAVQTLNNYQYNDEELSDEQAEEINEVGQVFKKQWDDFSPIPNNHRAQDFDRKWNHTRAKVSVQSLEDIPEDVPDQGYSVEEQAI